MPKGTEVQYLVLSDSTGPYLLARVHWPEVAQAISAGCPHWLDDVGLFDLPDDPNSAPVTFAHACEIALAWGAQIHGDPAAGPSAPALIRRMPANWSNLTPAEKRAWSLDVVTTQRRSRRKSERTRVRLATAESDLDRRRWALSAHNQPQPARPDPQLTISGGPADTDTAAGEDVWQPVIESMPGRAVNGGVNGAANGVVKKDRRLPTVFSRMGDGASAQRPNADARSKDLSKASVSADTADTGAPGRDTEVDHDLGVASGDPDGGHSRESQIHS